MLSIAATQSSPKIEYQPDTHTLWFEGESYPDNSFEFFKPVFDWFETQLPALPSLTVKIKIAYMNSSSTKCMLDILDLLADRAAEGGDIQVLWYVDPGNERARDLAEEFLEDMELNYEIIAV
jgi:hypothetical protein